MSDGTVVAVSHQTNTSFYGNKELDHAFNEFLMYHMKILFGNFNAKVGRGSIFKPVLENERVYIKLIMIMALCNIKKSIKSTIFPHSSI
jgi:hypothetical protein